MKRLLSLLLAFLLCLTPAMAEGLSQSGETISVALSQMGYTEGAKELTKYGQWYGIPHGYWCDMFVSWCARQAGLSKDVFPSSASCGEHYRMFKAKGQWQDSASRGGTYEPLQGDLVLFRSISSGVISHIGYVLYVEDGCLFTVEGNTLTKRLDYPPEVTSPLQKESKDPPDYVTVNQYPLNDKRLYGYATPAYSSREPLEMEGYVDLAKYEEMQPQLAALAEAGIMRGTSSHTFAPRLGMGRGAFVESVISLCGLNGWAEDTPVFADVQKDSPYYDALMTARSAGLLEVGGDGKFNPDIYISGPDAQAILSKARALLNLEARQDVFTDGDLSYMLTPYTIRIDIAKALYAFLQELPAPKEEEAREVEIAAFDGAVTYRKQTLDWPVRTMEEAYYVPLPALLTKFPELSASGLPEEPAPAPSDETAEAPDSKPADSKPAEEDTGLAPANSKLVEKDTGLAPSDSKPAEEDTGLASDKQPEMAMALQLTLEMEGRQVPAEGFRYEGTVYVSLDTASNLLGVKLQATPAKKA